MTPLQQILAAYRATSQTEREKGTYFEELIRTYFRNEPRFADLYSDVWLYADWAKGIGGAEFGFNAKDTGIDLVAKTRGTDEYHAIQCKCYAEGYRVRKADIDSFFNESGKKPFTHRYIVSTTNDWSENAEQSLGQQQIPTQKIDLNDLESSQIDWAKYQPSAAPVLKPKKQLRPHQTSAKGKVVKGLETENRGKLIMACGTGKTFTSLKIAEELKKRHDAQHMGVEKYADGFKVRQHEAALAIPFGWKKPAMVFVNSMSDLFYKDVPVEFIQKVFRVMNANEHLIFQVLTKRSERLAELRSEFTWSQNIWMGVSVEDEKVTHRIDDLRKVPAAVRFLSCEPLIGPLRKLNLKGIDWVIVGGESGACPRPMNPEWAISIRDQCEKHDVAFFFKQWGGRNKKAAGRELDGAFYDEFPKAKTRRPQKA